jgi:hypothetical protein
MNNEFLSESNEGNEDENNSTMNPLTIKNRGMSDVPSLDTTQENLLIREFEKVRFG